ITPENANYNNAITVEINVTDTGCGNANISSWSCLATGNNTCVPTTGRLFTTHDSYELSESGTYNICTQSVDSAGNSSSQCKKYTVSFEVWDKYETSLLYDWEKWNTVNTPTGYTYDRYSCNANYSYNSNSSSYVNGADGTYQSNNIATCPGGYYTNKIRLYNWTRWNCKPGQYGWVKTNTTTVCYQREPKWDYFGQDANNACQCDSNNGNVYGTVQGRKDVDVFSSYYLGGVWVCANDSKYKSVFVNGGTPGGGGCNATQRNITHESYSCKVTNWKSDTALERQYNLPSNAYDEYYPLSICNSIYDSWWMSDATNTYRWDKHDCYVASYSRGPFQATNTYPSRKSIGQCTSNEWFENERVTDQSYSKGTTQYANVTSFDANAYLTNQKNNDGFWYSNKTSKEVPGDSKGEIVIASPGTYPTNGKHTDGSWYIKRPSPKVRNIDYTGNKQTYTADKTGNYQIELWGAGGGKNSTIGNNVQPGGKGGYTKGNIYLNKNDVLDVYVGQKGENGYNSPTYSTSTSYNGGGFGKGSGDADDCGGAGGGATDVRLPQKYRYIRDYLKNSNLNLHNHWIEIEVYDTANILISKNKNVTASFTPYLPNSDFTSLTSLVDGNKATVPWISSSQSDQEGWVEIDLGAEYNIGDIKIWHYYGDNRIYYENKTILYNNSRSIQSVISAAQGNYVETVAGHNLLGGANQRLMVAGGGGGAAETHNANQTGGNAGGLTGTGNIYEWDQCLLSRNMHGTQNSGNSFGSGGNGLSISGPSTGGGGGGGGYYGGQADTDSNNDCNPAVKTYSAGGGGSSFISGYSGCNAVNTNGVHTGQPNHYSGKIFTSSSMINGSNSMPNPRGSGTITGNSGNGYAKITYIGS
ncbi:MAG: glycine rich domain-containing protein, partial [Bacilli bacterium]